MNTEMMAELESRRDAGFAAAMSAGFGTAEYHLGMHEYFSSDADQCEKRRYDAEAVALLRQAAERHLVRYLKLAGGVDALPETTGRTERRARL